MADTGAMKKGERFRLVAVIGLVVALMSAGFALAGDAFDEPSDEPTTCVPDEEPEGCEEADDTNETEAPADDEAEEGDDEAVLEPTVERTEECLTAAAMEGEDAPEDKPVAGELKGLENAISHVLWNCMRNDNDGLVNALEHLSANLERKEFRDEAKEERKTEREAARAARDAAKAERRTAHEAAKAARELARAS